MNAYEVGVKLALDDTGLTEKIAAYPGRMLYLPTLLGAEVGGLLGAVSPETVGHDPLYEHPLKRIAIGSGKGTLGGAAAGLGLGAAGLGGIKLLESLLKLKK